MTTPPIPFLRRLRPLLLGRRLRGPERYGPFCIVGSARCGTTLLRAMLEAHPDVHIPPGNVMLRAVIRDYRWYSHLPWSPLLRLLLTQMAFHPSWEAFDLPLHPVFRELVNRPAKARNLAAVINAVYCAHLARHKPAAVRWGDKSPFGVLGVRAFRAVFPDVRVVHIVRDGRDVVRSFVDAFGSDIRDAARTWLRAVRTAHAFGARYPTQYLEVRYEDLVRHPPATLEVVARFLDLRFDERMLRHHELGLRLGDVDRTSYMQGVWKPVYQTSIGRWRTEFDAGQIVELDRLMGPTLSALGYGGSL